MKNRWTGVVLFVLLSSTMLVGVPPPSPIENNRELYIELIKKVIANTIYEDDHVLGGYDYTNRVYGRDHPLLAHTMIGCKRLDNIHECLKDIIINNVPGDCIETGVWRGGATILMRAILKAYGDTERKVWVADSFQGLPLPDVQTYPKDDGNTIYHYMQHLAIPLETVKNNFQKYDLLDDQVVFLKGFFRDTLPDAPIEQLALLRLDGDMYESTIIALESLYPKLSIGGYVIIDDYGWIESSASATHDYRSRENITDPIIRADECGVYWKKTK